MSELSTLSEADRQKALARFRILEPHLTAGVPLTLVARNAGIPYRTAQRWVALYQRFGLAALARKGRTDRGTRRSLSPQMHKVVEGLALQKPPLPIATLYRQVYRLAVQQNEEPPSYAVVYAIVRQLPADLVMLAHEGSKAYADAFELVHRREAERPNAIWQADHTPLDILIRREKGKAAKPWLTVIIDDYSRAIAGYFLSFEAPSAIQTALALHQAIWRKEDARWHVCGIPDVLYTDNGSDFTSHHLEQVAADIKMQLVFSTPGKPRGRGRIERFFGVINSMFLSGLPGYTPTSLTTVAALERDVDRARRHGVAFDNEEIEQGLRCVAAPVRDDTGELVAGLSVSAPAERHNPDWIERVKQTADAISLAIGYQAPKATPKTH